MSFEIYSNNKNIVHDFHIPRECTYNGQQLICDGLTGAYGRHARVNDWGCPPLFLLSLYTFLELIFKNLSYYLIKWLSMNSLFLSKDQAAGLSICAFSIGCSAHDRRHAVRKCCKQISVREGAMQHYYQCSDCLVISQVASKSFQQTSEYNCVFKDYYIIWCSSI